MNRTNDRSISSSSPHLKTTIVFGKALQNQRVIRIVGLLMQGTMHSDMDDFSFLDFTQIEFMKFLHDLITILGEE